MKKVASLLFFYVLSNAAYRACRCGPGVKLGEGSSMFKPPGTAWLAMSTELARVKIVHLDTMLFALCLGKLSPFPDQPEFVSELSVVSCRPSSAGVAASGVGPGSRGDAGATDALLPAAAAAPSPAISAAAAGRTVPAPAPAAVSAAAAAAAPSPAAAAATGRRRWSWRRRRFRRW